MSIVLQKEIHGATWVLYQIEERDDFYIRHLDMTEFDREQYSHITHPEKKRQWLASRYVLKKISNENRTLYLQKSELGKPRFTNLELHFSISHSKEYIAIIYSKSKMVAIDIEKIQPKIRAISKKFLHPSESEYTDNTRLTLIWSAKEAIYKFFHTKDLYSFKETIIITHIDDNNIYADAVFSDRIEKLILNYYLYQDLVVVYYVCPVN